MWTIEDPHLTLETLAPYVLTSHMRDSALWRTPEGIAVRWTRMGEGNIGMEDYIRKYMEKCPGKAVSLEVIVTQPAADVQLRDPRILGPVRRPAGVGIRAFPRAGRQGQAVVEPPADPATTPAARNLANVEASIRWTQEFLAKL